MQPLRKGLHGLRIQVLPGTGRKSGTLGSVAPVPQQPPTRTSRFSPLPPFKQQRRVQSFVEGQKPLFHLQRARGLKQQALALDGVACEEGGRLLRQGGVPQGPTMIRPQRWSFLPTKVRTVMEACDAAKAELANAQATLLSVRAQRTTKVLL